MTPLYVIFAGVILGLITVVADSTQVYIYQRYLHSLADGAALAAADGIDEAGIYTGGLGEGQSVKLAEEHARRKVAEYMSKVEYRDSHQRTARCALGGIQGARVVTVQCQGSTALPLANWVTAGTFGNRVTVTSEASAEAFTPAP